MGKVYEALDDTLIEFIQAQHLFFVATAPLAADGHVNVSPKGMDALRVLDAHTVAYLDVTGSGVETLSHVRENGRLAMMFCAFAGRPLILRLHGDAEVLERGHADFDMLLPRFPALPGIRSIIRLNITRIADSCGWTVPQYTFDGTRDYYDRPDGMRKAQLAANMKSLDGLPGLTRPSF